MKTLDLGRSFSDTPLKAVSPLLGGAKVDIVFIAVGCIRAGVKCEDRSDSLLRAQARVRSMNGERNVYSMGISQALEKNGETEML